MPHGSQTELRLQATRGIFANLIKLFNFISPEVGPTGAKLEICYCFKRDGGMSVDMMGNQVEATYLRHLRKNCELLKWNYYAWRN